MHRAPIEICRVTSSHADALARFFELLTDRGIDKFFHPHPLTDEVARERAYYTGKDSYFAILASEEVLGYGMLRGWDDGYQIPSLGIVIHPDCQGQGLGRLLMSFLQVVAIRNGAKKIRLRVSVENHAAIRLYRALGYEFVSQKDGENLVGFLALDGD
jgi:[ribosomal protein S18]-alanine N-acetyltransferase